MSRPDVTGHWGVFRFQSPELEPVSGYVEHTPADTGDSFYVRTAGDSLVAVQSFAYATFTPPPKNAR